MFKNNKLHLLGMLEAIKKVLKYSKPFVDANDFYHDEKDIEQLLENLEA